MNDEESPNSLKRYNSAPQINNLLLANNNKPPKLSMNNAIAAARETTPTSFSNIFTPRARRFSASFSPLALSPNPRHTAKSQTVSYPSPRINQLRQEECAENLREVNHEREIHANMQMSQSYEDLTLVAENWSFKNNFDDISNPMNVTPSSRTATTGSLRLPLHHMSSPSPTRKSFATRRSMSPTMRPSSLSGVKRKFELDDNGFNTYSPPPFKRIFTDRGPSPSESESGGRTTPKLFASKIFSNANTNSLSSLSPTPSSGCDSEIVPSCLLIELGGGNQPPIIMSMDTGTILEEKSEHHISEMEKSTKIDAAKKFESLMEGQSADKINVNLTDNDKLLLEQA